ncbi:hypothetical protein ACFLVP_04015 [Chloroflexota bacterium]
MAIERFLEELGMPSQPKPLNAAVLKPSNPESASKPEVQSKKRDERLEKALKETGDNILRVEKGIKDLQSNITKRGIDLEATLSRLASIEAELRNLKSIQQSLKEYQSQVVEYIALAQGEKRCCPNCNADVDWPNLPFEKGSATWFDGCLRRTCPECGHQTKAKSNN